MPQLDFNVAFSNLIFLIVFFIIFYFLTYFYILKKIVKSILVRIFYIDNANKFINKLTVSYSNKNYNIFKNLLKLFI